MNFLVFECRYSDVFDRQRSFALWGNGGVAKAATFFGSVAHFGRNARKAGAVISGKSLPRRKAKPG